MTPFSRAKPGWRHPEPGFGEGSPYRDLGGMDSARESPATTCAGKHFGPEKGFHFDDLTGESWGGGGSIYISRFPLHGIAALHSNDLGKRS